MKENKKSLVFEIIISVEFIKIFILFNIFLNELENISVGYLGSFSITNINNLFFVFFIYAITLSIEVIVIAFSLIDRQ